MRIAIIDDYQNVVPTLGAFKMLAGHHVDVFNHNVTDVNVLASMLHHAEVIVLIRDRTNLGEDLIARLPNLRLVSSVCRPGAHIDLEACTQRGIAVADGGPGYSPATIEVAWGLILSAMHKLGLEGRKLYEGKWQTSIGVGCLYGRTLGIFGFGKLGSMMANIGPAFGMRVLVHGSENTMCKAAKAGYAIEKDRAAFFGTADVLSLHLRLNTETRGSITEEDLAHMKSDAVFVNVSRAALVKPGALVEALKKGRPGYAAIDVYDREPVLNASDPLVRMDNVVCSPHMGYVDMDSYSRYFDIAFRNILAFASGNPCNIVNPEVLAGGMYSKQ